MEIGAMSASPPDGGFGVSLRSIGGSVAKKRSCLLEGARGDCGIAAPPAHLGSALSAKAPPRARVRARPPEVQNAFRLPLAQAWRSRSRGLWRPPANYRHDA